MTRRDFRGFRLTVAAIASVGLLSACQTTAQGEGPAGAASEIALQAAINDAVEAAVADDGTHAGPGIGETFVDPARNIAFKVVGFDALDGWEADDHAAALDSFQRSCRRILRLDETIVLGGLASRIEDWAPSCEAAAEVNAVAARAFFELAFTPIRIAPDEEALVTSYYEPELEARRTPTAEFRFPLYAKPDELTTRGGRYGVLENGALRPFYTRGQINDGALDGRGLEIAYLNDAVDSFFLHVQGSGRLRFEDGSIQRVAFAAKNGHPYASAGRAMLRAGVLPRRDASADGIKAYVRANPERGMTFLAANKSYIFFRKVNGLDPNVGPEGALGVQLADQRSIAVDRRFTPLGAPVWLESGGPQGDIRRLVVAQDTGSAIKGPQRADYFWGSGAEAGSIAGRMKHRGQMFVLLPTATVKRLTENDAS